MAAAGAVEVVGCAGAPASGCAAARRLRLVLDRRDALGAAFGFAPAGAGWAGARRPRLRGSPAGERPRAGAAAARAAGWGWWRRGLRGRRGARRGAPRRLRAGCAAAGWGAAGWLAGAAAAFAFGPSAFFFAEGGPAGPWAPGLASAWSATPKAQRPPNKALSDLTGTRSMAVGLTADWSCTVASPVALA